MRCRSVIAEAAATSGGSWGVLGAALPAFDRLPVLALSTTKRWVITFAATAVSTYALDAVATAAGVLLIASQVLRGLDHALVLVFLVGTYIVWWAGLRVNLRANWALLEDTGTSTNVVSKAAYDLIKLRTGNVRALRMAAAAGYVGTEVAKEAPYYAGAFGAALLIDSVTANDALIFLGGANLGAAAYEYGLAHLVRAFLHRKEAPAYASFETDWMPNEYLADYYSRVEADERETIAFFVDAIRGSPPDEPILSFGVGPTLHHVFLAVNKASEIHLGDYVRANLREIERWIRRDTDTHDWRPFVRYTLECEGVASPTEAEITQREDATRAKITKLFEVDIRRTDPLGERNTPPYGTVISAYCADSATGDRGAWQTYMSRIAGLVRPGGTLVTAALRRSRGYFVGGKTFPSPNVDENDLRAVLQPYFGREDITIQVCELPGTASKGYASIVLACGHRRRVEPVNPVGAVRFAFPQA
jgi:NNMT/PNMT/TEMT family